MGINMVLFYFKFGWFRCLGWLIALHADVNTGYRTLFAKSIRSCAQVRHCRLRSMAALLLVAACMPAEAVDYTFPGNLPVSCRGSGGSYTCSELTLAAGDTISVASRTSIIVNGALTTGYSSQINHGGAVSDLSIAVTGITDLGPSTSVTANLMGEGAVTMGTLGRFTGDIKTQSAAINIGTLSVVNGSLETVVAGVVNVGANSRVSGSIITLSGAINIGANAQVDGLVSSRHAGVVTLGESAIVGGNVMTVSGAINVGARSNVAGYLLSTLAGAVTVGDNAIVGGVGTKSGAITIGTGSRSVGSVCSSKAGAITLNDNTEVAGNLATRDGAITVGDGSQVKGSVNAVVGAVTISSSAKVGNVANNVACPQDLYEASLAPQSKPTKSIPVIKSREWRHIFMR